MNRFSSAKIKNILHDWPTGMVVTYSWLAAYDVYPQLVDHYVKYGWLEKLAKGAFAKLGDKPTWAGAIYALQQQLYLPIHIGGRTAIEIQGYGHYARLKPRLDLYAQSGVKLPAWFKKLDFNNATFHYTATSLFGKSTLEIHKQSIDNFGLNCSSLERAMLEMLAFIPQHYGYEEAAHLMESLRGLRPGVVQALLEQCHSIKAKRLFLHLAALCNHDWLKRIDISKVDLGSGIRKLPGGTLFDKAYQLYVPGNPLNEGYSPDELSTNLL